MKGFAFQGPPSAAVAAGATTPAGDYLGAKLWSTTTGSALTWDGTAWAEEGDVLGPASSAENALAIFDGTTGKLLKSDQHVLINISGTSRGLNLESSNVVGNLGYAEIFAKEDGLGGSTLGVYQGSYSANAVVTSAHAESYVGNSSDYVYMYVNSSVASKESKSGAHVFRIDTSNAIGTQFFIDTSYGTAGQILTSGGPSGSISWTTVGALTDGDKGDVAVSSSGTVWTIDNDAITYAKLQNISATDKILGRATAGAGDVEEITCTAAGRALLDDVDVAAQRTTLGLGTAATQATGAFATAAQGVLADTAIQDVGATTFAATSKTTPVDADNIPLSDSAASNGLKKLTWANLKATVKTYFDTLYATAAQGTDAREWTAATVSQAVAESGTDTARAAWTAQRVAQAISAQVAAWWTALTVPASKITLSDVGLVGKSTGGSGASERIVLGTNLSFSGATLNASGGGATNLTYTASPTDGAVVSDTGTDATLSLVDATNAGLMAPAQHTKLAGIATNATANSSDATLLARANHTGTQTASTISDFVTAADARITSAVGVSVQAYDADLVTWAGVTPGTGVGTALTGNVGMVGAIVTNGGALGTPSSATLTNASGLPASGVVGTAIVSAAIGTTVQAYDNTLDSLAALDASTGVIEQTGSDSFVKRALGVAAGTSILTRADGDGRFQPLDTTLTAVANLNATAGLVEQTGADTFTKRAIGVAASTDIPTRADTDARQIQQKAIYLPDPTTADTKIAPMYCDVGMTIVNVAAVLPGGTATPSVTFNYRYGSDVSAAGTAVITGGVTVTSATTGLSTNSINNANISSGNFVWLEVTAKSGTVPVLAATLSLRRT